MRNYSKDYTISLLVPAGSYNQVFSKDMDGSVIFHCQEVRGQFSTLELTDPLDPVSAIIDNGVSSLSFKIVEAGSDYQFMDEPVPVEMLLVPGRVKDSRATNNATAPASNPIYSPRRLVHDFTKKISVFANNTGSVDQLLTITFIGTEEQVG